MDLHALVEPMLVRATRVHRLAHTISIKAPLRLFGNGENCRHIRSKGKLWFQKVLQLHHLSAKKLMKNVTIEWHCYLLQCHAALHLKGYAWAAD